MSARQPTSFRLSPDAVESLERLAARHAMPRSELLEWLLTGIARPRHRAARPCTTAARGKAADIRYAVQLARTAHALLRGTGKSPERLLAHRLLHQAYAVIADCTGGTGGTSSATPVDEGVTVSPTDFPNPELVALLLGGGEHDHP